MSNLSNSCRIFFGCHPFWSDLIFIYSNEGLVRPGVDKGTCSITDQEHIILKWENWPQERLTWNEKTQSYHCSDKNFTLKEIKFDKIHFDVGINEIYQSEIEHYAANGINLWAFEPIPEQFQKVKDATERYSNIQLTQSAVYNFNGKSKFNVANHSGCSSLFEFTDTVNEDWVREEYPLLDSFHTIKEIEVDVVRLDTFMEDHNIPHIDFLHIDAQGADLEIVKSLGTRLTDVNRIEIEVCIQEEPLYKNQFTKKEAIEFFEDNSFAVENVEKQSLDREENIIFRNTACNFTLRRT